MAGYSLGLCGRPGLRDHHIGEESSWMVLPPYPQYAGTAAGSHGIATSAGISAMAGSLVGVSSMGHHPHPHAAMAAHHGAVADYTALASSLQQRRSPLSSAAYTHSWSVLHQQTLRTVFLIFKEIQFFVEIHLTLNRLPK